MTPETCFELAHVDSTDTFKLEPETGRGNGEWGSTFGHGIDFECARAGARPFGRSHAEGDTFACAGTRLCPALPSFIMHPNITSGGSKCRRAIGLISTIDVVISRATPASLTGSELLLLSNWLWMLISRLDTVLRRSTISCRSRSFSSVIRSSCRNSFAHSWYSICSAYMSSGSCDWHPSLTAETGDTGATVVIALCRSPPDSTLSRPCRFAVSCSMSSNSIGSDRMIGDCRVAGRIY